MTPFCPCCGFNLTADEPVELGRWLVSADEVRLDGQRIALTGCEIRLMHTVATKAPRAVRRFAVQERLSDAESADNIVSVMMCRIRRKLGADMPIETIRGVGLRWRELDAIEANHAAGPSVVADQLSSKSEGICR